MNKPVLSRVLNAARELFGQLGRLNEFLPQLGLRFLLAYEFWESGVVKFHGETGSPIFRSGFRFPSISCRWI